MRPRHLFVALLAPALLALPAEAAPRGDACARLLVDGQGDVPTIASDLDLVSASLSLTPKTFTVTLRLADTPPSGLDPRMSGYALVVESDDASLAFYYQPWSVTGGRWSSYVTLRGTSIVWSMPREESGLPPGPLLVRDAYAGSYVASGHAVDYAHRARSMPIRCGS